MAFSLTNLLTGKAPVPGIKPISPVAPAPVVKPAPKTFYRDEGSSLVTDNTGHKYSTPQEFFNAGGKWENVQIRKANPQVANQLTGKIGTSTTLPNYTPRSEASIRPPQASNPNMISEIAKSVINPIGTIPALAGTKPVLNFAKGVVQGTATSGAAIGQGVFDVAKGMTQGLTPAQIAFNVTKQRTVQLDPNSLEGKLSNILFGRTDMPSISQYGKEAASVIPGGEGFAQRNPNIAFGLGLGMAALDFTGAGKSKNVAKALALAKDIPSVEKLLKTVGLADDVVKEFAPKIVKTTDEVGIQRILKEIETRKIVDPLITEARKYKSAEEFVSNQKPLFRGATPENMLKDKGRGISFATDKEVANRFSTQDFNGFPQKGEVGEFYLRPDAKILDPDTITAQSMKMDKTRENIMKYARDNGYDAVDLTKVIDPKSGFKPENELRIINKDALKTKSQLTDIWKKAREVKPTTQAPKVVSKERGFITSAKEKGVNVEGTTGVIRRDTENLAIRARNLVKEDIATAEKVAKGTDDKAVAVTSELIKHYDNLAKTATDEASKNLALDKISVIANETARNLTEAGRTVQAAKILNMQTPEGNLRFAAGLIQKYNDLIDKKGTGLLGLRKKIPELSREQAQQILDESKRVFDMPEGEAKAIAFQKLQNQISSLIPSSLYDKVVSVWKAGLLTGLKTTGVNLSANLSHGVTENIKDIPAAVVDKLTSLFTGKRTLALTSKGSANGAKEGFTKGLRYFRTGYDERNIAQKLDYNKVNFTSKGGKILQKYTDTVFHLLGAEDQPFYYGAKARSLYSQAIADAKNLGLKGKELTAHVDNLVANPTEQMIKYATHDAEVAVFQNKTLLGNVAQKIQKVPGGQVVVPFGRTPAAVATQIINYSPVGAVKTIIENIGKGKFDQRMFSQGMGRAITGTGAIAIGSALFAKGMITLGYPTDAKEQKLWELEGKKPNSVKIGDKWRSIAVLGPLGNALLVGGYYKKALNETGSPTSALAQAAAGAGKSLTEQTFLQGLNQFTSAINDPSGYGPSLLGNLIGSTIPTIVGDIAQTNDPLQRKSSATKNGLLAPLQAKIPGLRNKLEPKVDVQGQQILRPGNKLETLLDPTRPSKALSGDIIKELRRLSDTGNLATPTGFADDKKFKIPQSDKTGLQYSAGALFKEKVTKLLKTEDYKNLTDEEKAKKILDFADKSRMYARAYYVQSQVDNLQGEELKAKLKQLKESGVMTKEVYTLWEKL